MHCYPILALDRKAYFKVSVIKSKIGAQNISDSTYIYTTLIEKKVIDRAKKCYVLASYMAPRSIKNRYWFHI